MLIDNGSLLVPSLSHIRFIPDSTDLIIQTCWFPILWTKTWATFSHSNFLTHQFGKKKKEKNLKKNQSREKAPKAEAGKAESEIGYGCLCIYFLHPYLSLPPRLSPLPPPPPPPLPYTQHINNYRVVDLHTYIHTYADTSSHSPLSIYCPVNPARRTT